MSTSPLRASRVRRGWHAVFRPQLPLHHGTLQTTYPLFQGSSCHPASFQAQLSLSHAHFQVKKWLQNMKGNNRIKMNKSVTMNSFLLTTQLHPNSRVSYSGVSIPWCWCEHHMFINVWSMWAGCLGSRWPPLALAFLPTSNSNWEPSLSTTGPFCIPVMSSLCFPSVWRVVSLWLKVLRCHC